MCAHNLYFEELSIYLKEIKMTLTETKHKDNSAVTPQQHHTQAAEHLDLAAKSHKEVAKLIGSNDHKGAAEHVKVATQHVANAQEHVIAAAKKTAEVKK